MTIQKWVRENGRLPHINRISQECGLSRKTIHKHLKEMKQSEFLGHEIEKYEMGLFAIMDKLLAQGLD